MKNNKNIFNLSQQDKMDIIFNYQNKFLKEIDSLSEVKATIFGIFGVLMSVIALLVAILVNPLALRIVLVSIFACAFTELICDISARKSFKKMVTKKITYTQFKEFIKSGEFTKWEREFLYQYRNMSVEEYQYQSAKNKYLEQSINKTNDNKNTIEYNKENEKL